MVLVRHLPERPSIRFSLVCAELMPADVLANIRRIFLREFGEFTEHRPAIKGLDAYSFHAKSRYFAADSSLNPAEALERFTERLGQVRTELAALAAQIDADCALVTGSLADRGPKMIVTDVDSTFITTEVIEMLAAAAGTEDLVREITTQAMRGELDFADSLAERVATLKGVPDSVFATLVDEVELTEGAAALVEAIHEHGGAFCLVSGGFHEVVDGFATPLSIDFVLANRLDVADGVLTGRLDGAVVDREAKASAVRRWAKLRGYSLEDVLVAGDGANDIGMMQVAGLSVAFCAQPVVAAHADSSLRIRRLDALAALVGWDSPL